MIELVTTAESVERAVESLVIGVDALCIEKETFGLRLPASSIRDEQREIVRRVHEMGRQVLVTVSSIMHPEKVKLAPGYLTFLREVNVNKITLGDPGTVFIMQRDGLEIPYVYDGETLVMSSRQINFWSKRGVIGAVLAREVPFEGVVATEENLAAPAETLAYGTTYIRQSKRPLIQGYYNYTRNDRGVTKDEGLFISEPKEPGTHHSTCEDGHGARTPANNSVNLMNELINLYDHHCRTRELDGLYTPGGSPVAIACLSAEAKATLEARAWPEDRVAHAIAEIEKLHPTGRGLGDGFFDLSADTIK